MLLNKPILATYAIISIISATQTQYHSSIFTCCWLITYTQMYIRKNFEHNAHVLITESSEKIAVSSDNNGALKLAFSKQKQSL